MLPARRNELAAYPGPRLPHTCNYRGNMGVVWVTGEVIQGYYRSTVLPKIVAHRLDYRPWDFSLLGPSRQLAFDFS